MYTVSENNYIIFEFVNPDMCKSRIKEFMTMIGYECKHYIECELERVNYLVKTKHYTLTKVNMISLGDGSFVYQI